MPHQGRIKKVQVLLESECNASGNFCERVHDFYYEKINQIPKDVNISSLGIKEKVTCDVKNYASFNMKKGV